MLLFFGILKWVLLAIAIISVGFFIFMLSIDDITVEKLFFDDDSYYIGFILTSIFIGSLIGFLLLTFSVIPKHRAKYYSDEALLERAAAQDMAELESAGSIKMQLQDMFKSTKEPLLYVIAPMTYDTKQFVQDNSHDKALFGTKDNSAERLTVLESCITDFIRAVDDKTGVSFLDRSKISQIEKEHKFQLGDWSSASKTAEMGHALNANVLLFLDKFGFVDQGSGEYRFEAKFVDINTMQSSVYNISYQNAKKKITTPGVVQTISFRDFTAIPAESAPFSDELSLTVKNALRTVQRSDMAETCPLGAVQKFALSEYDTLQPKTELLKLSSIIFDGFGGAELRWGDKSENATYSFTQSVPRTERVVNSFYTDGRIGTLTLKTSAGEETLDVYTADNREFYLRAGTANLTSTTVNYYLHMTRN
ncbi:MAG: hypothetical protein IJP61_07310 [Treponema sp.]|nr:hypothetical protein [Treponema sp.]